MFKKIIICFFVVASFAGCLKESTSNFTCSYDPCATKAPDAEIQAVKAYLDSAGITATQHCSGAFYAIDTLGTGNAPTACSLIAVTYKGTLKNDVVFDQGSAQLYLTNLIAGWRNTLPLIKEGGTIRLYIPPSLGYGTQSPGPTVPANSMLIFRIKLLGVAP